MLIGGLVSVEINDRLRVPLRLPQQLSPTTQDLTRSSFEFYFAGASQLALIFRVQLEFADGRACF